MATKRRNQNVNRQGAKKVNYRMREGSNYYGDVSGVKNKSTARKQLPASGVAADRAKGAARTSGRTADSRGGRGGSTRAEDMRNARKAPSKNYKKGLYR